MNPTLEFFGKILYIVSAIYALAIFRSSYTFRKLGGVIQYLYYIHRLLIPLYIILTLSYVFNANINVNIVYTGNLIITFLFLLTQPLTINGLLLTLEVKNESN